MTDRSFALEPLLDLAARAARVANVRFVTDASPEPERALVRAAAGERVVVADASRDARFADAALVAGAPFVRAICLVPARSPDGAPCGTLVAWDPAPRSFAADDMAAFEACVTAIAAHVELANRIERSDAALQAVAESERVYRTSFERAAVGIAHTSPDGWMFRVNARLCEILGRSREELLATSVAAITHPDDVDENLRLFRATLAGERAGYRMEKRFLTGDGSYVWAMLSVALQRSPSGAPEYAIAMVEDISARKAAERELFELHGNLERRVAAQTERLSQRNRDLDLAERRLRTIANNVPAMIGYWNNDLRCEFANDAYHRWFGLAADRVVGMNLRELMGETLFALNEPHVRAALAGTRQHFERRLVTPDGTPTVVDAHYVPDVDDAGAVRGFYVLVTDVTALHSIRGQLEATNAMLQQRASVDYLTGIANRRTFGECAAEAFDRFRDDGTPFGLVLFDIDSFKSANDTYGHEVGDDVLRTVGDIVRANLRASDVAARIGGEEFAIVTFADVEPDALLAFAERIRSAISRGPIATTVSDVAVTASVGATCAAPGDAAFRDVYARADAALYAVKRSGKNRARFEAPQADLPT